MRQSELATDLPIDDILDELISSLASQDQVILEAPPGAGKTTRVPLALVNQSWLNQQKIILLEPRRLAAKNAAYRMAELLNEDVGQTIGYRMRMESCCSSTTRIEVVTEGVLSRMLQQDPSLSGVGLVIFDEFHERSVDADLGLALCLQSAEFFRDDSSNGPENHSANSSHESDTPKDTLKILIMSATLDTDTLKEKLPSAPVIASQGRSFPVEVRYTGSLPNNQTIETKVVSTIQQALAQEPGSLLVFLPGTAEIKRTEVLLQESLPTNTAASVNITPLYGQLSLAEQRKAILPSSDNKRKIVLATSIAESSLTIEGIRIVIDSGLSRSAQLDPVTGMTRLKTQPSSQATSEQRAGRAGRMEAGVCIRLWSETQHSSRAKQTAPEITEADLTNLCLQVHRWGCLTPDELDWITPPPSALYAQSQDLLMRLGALKTTSLGTSLTQHGTAMAELPTHPRLAHLLLQAKRLGIETLGCEIAALLSERDHLYHHGAGFLVRLEWLRDKNNEQAGLRAKIRKQQKIFAQKLKLARLPKNIEPYTPPSTEQEQVSLLVAFAWPDRIACRKGSKDNQGRYILPSGRAATLHETDRLVTADWLAIAQLGGKSSQTTDRIWLAAEFNADWLDHYFSDHISTNAVTDWDENNARVISKQQKRYGEIIIASQPSPAHDEAKKNQLLLKQVRQKGISCFGLSKPTQKWLDRMYFIYQDWQESHTDSGANPWPDLSETQLIDTLDEWLSPWLADCNSLADLRQLNIAELLASRLDWSQQSELNSLAPPSISVPSGRKVEIDYSEYPPILAVKLQEMFGCQTNPKIGYQCAVKLHLLSPAGRPLQITQDIGFFWANSYTEVKKEMKGRYPKHPWPDNPITATSSAKTKKALNKD